MFFLSLLIFILPAMVMPWWGLALVALALGVWRPQGWWYGMQVGLAAGWIWVAAAYVDDGNTSGLITRRLSMAMGLPSPWLLLGLMGALGFVTAFLFYQAGSALRRFRT